MPRPEQPRPGKPKSNYSETVLETEEDIRRALGKHLQQATDALLASPAPRLPSTNPPPIAPADVPPSAATPRGSQGARPYRPTVRAPIALLTVFDDGKDEGEVIRIRSPRFVIGRTEGDLTIPIDGRISARHVEISLQQNRGEHAWVVADLQSANGMFVRVTRTPLADGAEFLVAGGRYRFSQLMKSGEAFDGEAAAPGAFDDTRGWGAASTAPLPVLVELLGDEVTNRILLARPEYWIGSDPSCAIGRADDPFCEPRHVRIHRDPQGKWHAEHPKTHNGLWLRMNRIVATSLVQFQIGEQRFKLKIGQEG